MHRPQSFLHFCISCTLSLFDFHAAGDVSHFFMLCDCRMVSVGEYSGLKQPLQNIKTLKLGLGNHPDCGSSSKKNNFNINKEMRNRSRCRLKQTQHRKRYFLCDTNSQLASTSADMTDPPVSLWVGLVGLVRR